MEKIRVPFPVGWLPSEFGNEMSAIEAVYKLSKAYNDIADNIWDISYNEDTRTLVIKEHEEG